MPTIIDIIKKCDSWSTEVEDLGPDTKGGRYGVTVFFDTENDAKDFMSAVQIETLSL